MPARATPRPVVERVETGHTAAELSYLFDNDPERLDERFTDVHLTIYQAGVSVLARELRNEAFEGWLWPAASPQRKSLSLRQLDGDPALEVAVALFTGGASCCFLLDVYDGLGDGRGYRRLRRDFGRGGFKFVNYDRDRRVELQGGDVRFTCLYAACAFTPTPVQILSLRDRRFRDVTRRHSTVIAADARRIFGWYLRERRGRYGEVRGYLAAWVADQFLLGRAHGERAWRHLERVRLSGELDRAQRIPSSSAFLRDLRLRLRRWGYIR